MISIDILFLKEIEKQNNNNVLLNIKGCIKILQLN